MAGGVAMAVGVGVLADALEATSPVRVGVGRVGEVGGRYCGGWLWRGSGCGVAVGVAGGRQQWGSRG